MRALPPKGHHKSRSWSVTEEDGSEDGRVVCWGLTKADAVRIVRLLNEDERKGVREDGWV